MKKKFKVLTLSAMLFALCLPAAAQQPKKVHRIGYLSPTNPATDSSRFEPFRAALRELGYIEGQNITIEYRLHGGLMLVGGLMFGLWALRAWWR